MAIFCDEGFLTRLHYAPDVASWNPSPPPLEIISTIATTDTRHNGLRRTPRYATPLWKLPNRKMNTWPEQDQLKALAQAYVQIGEQLKQAPPPYLPREYIEQAKREMANRHKSREDRKNQQKHNTTKSKTPLESKKELLPKDGTVKQKQSNPETKKETPSENNKLEVDLPPEIAENFPADSEVPATVSSIIICRCYQATCPMRNQPEITEITTLAVNSNAPAKGQPQMLQMKKLEEQYNCVTPISILGNLPYCQFKLCQISGKALLDSGSALDLCSLEMAKKIEKNQDSECLWDKEARLEAMSCDKKRLEIKGTISIPVFQLHESNPPIRIECWVLEDSFAPVIIGCKTLTELKGVLIPAQKRFYYTAPSIQDAPSTEEETATTEKEVNNEYMETGEQLELELQLQQGAIQIRIPTAQHTILPQEKIDLTLPAHKYPNLAAATTVNTKAMIGSLPAIITKKERIRGEVLHVTIINTSNEKRQLNEKTINVIIPHKIAATTKTAEEVQENIQRRLDPKENLGFPGLQPPKEKILFPTIDEFGPAPFHEDTPNFVIFLAYLLILYGHTTRLKNKTSEQLEELMNEYIDIPGSKKLLKTVQETRKRHDIKSLYYYNPLRIVAELHKVLTISYQNINEISISQATNMQKIKNTNIITERLFKNTQALAILFYLNAGYLMEQCDMFGRPAFFHFTEKELPFPQMVPSKEVEIINSITHQAQIKTETELAEIMHPQAKPYLQPQETFEQRVFNSYEKLQREAEQQVAGGNMEAKRQALQLDDIQSEEDLRKLLDFSKSPAALHQFCADQTGNDLTKTIPLTEFHQSLREAKWTIYQSTEEVEQDYIPTPMRDEFRKFMKLIQDPTFLKTSTAYRLPDLPPVDAFKDPTLAPSPLYILEGPLTGLIDTAYLAFMCAPLLPEGHIILQAAHKIDLYVFGALLFTYGQFIFSTHQNQVGLLDKRVFLVRTILSPSAPISLQPSKAAQTAINPELDDKLDMILKYGRAKLLTGSPYLTTWTAIRKNRKECKPLIFDDPTLQYLLELSETKQSQLAQNAETIIRAEEEAVRDIKEPMEPETEHVNAITSAPKNLWHQWSNLEALEITAILSNVTWQSATPPTEREIAMFTKGIATKPIDPVKRAKQIKQEPEIRKVRFGNVYCIKQPPTTTETTRISPTFRQYFVTEADLQNYQQKAMWQQVGSQSKHLLGNLEPPEKNITIQYVVPAIPNLPQLSKHAINPQVTKSQNFLTNSNTVHHLIKACSTMSYEKMTSHEDENYPDLCWLAQNTIDPNNPIVASTLDSQILIQATQNSRKLQETMWALLNTAEIYDETNKQSGKNEEIATIAGTNQHPRNSQIQRDFQQYCRTILTSSNDATKLHTLVSHVNDFTRALRHKGNLQTLSTTRTLTQSVMKYLDLKQNPEEWDKIEIAQLTSPQKPIQEIMKQYAEHLQLPIIAVFGKIEHLKRRPEFIAEEIIVFGAEHFDTETRQYSGIAIGSQTMEAFQLKAKYPKLCEELIKIAGTTATKTYSIQTALITMQEAQAQQQEAHDDRYTITTIPHLEKRIFYKKSATRFIVNSKFTNKCARPTATQFQSLSSIQQILASSTHFTSFDFTSMYDQIPADAISSLLSCIAYRNLHIASTVASMGGTNSCIFATAVSLSLFYHVKDKLAFNVCYRPKPLPKNITLPPTREPMTTEQSYDMTPPLNQPACALMRMIVDREIYQDRQETTEHFLPISERERKRLLATSRDSVIRVTTLIDDNAIATRVHESFQHLTKAEIDAIMLKLHILAVKQLFQSMIQASPAPSKQNPCPASMKLKLEKSVFLAQHCRFLNVVYLDNYQIIQLEAYKKNYDALQAPPTTGDGLRSILCFLTHFLIYIPKLRYLSHDLEAFARQHPGAQKLGWTTKLKDKYKTLTAAAQLITGLKALPDDLAQLEHVVISSDACPNTIAFNIGLVLKTPGKEGDGLRETTCHLYRNYSANLPEHLKNTPIALKEAIACTKTIDQEAELLQLIKAIPKFFIVDNANLFAFLNKLAENNQLAPHLGAHPIIQQCILRLFEALHTFNGSLILAKSKYCIADALTRSTPETQKKKLCSSTTKKADCMLCETCNMTCIRATPHQQCKFNVRNSQTEPGPQILEYDTIETRSVTTSEETVTFTAASCAFEQHKYIEIDLHPIIRGIPLASPTELHFPQRDEQTPLHWLPKNPGQIQEQRKEEITQVQRKLKELITPVIGHIATRQQHKGTTLSDTRANIIKHRLGRKLWITYPNLVAMHTKAEMRLCPPDQIATIVVFIDKHKGFWTGRSVSKYVDKLKPTSASRLEMKANSITTITQENKHYIILCVDAARTSQPHATNQTITQLTAVMAEIRKTRTEQIIFDQNSLERVYNITPQTTMLIIALLTSQYIRQLPTITVHSHPIKQEQERNKNKNVTPPKSQKIERRIPIVIMGTRIALLKVELDEIGECGNALQAIRDIMKQHQIPTRFAIEVQHPAERQPIHQNTNWVTASEIALRRREPVLAIGEFKEVDDPVHAELIAQLKIRLNQSQDPTLIAIKMEAKKAAKNNDTITSPCKTVEIKLEEEVLWGRYINDPSSQAFKPILAEANILEEILHTHKRLGCASLANTVKRIKEEYFHQQGITSPHSLTQLGKTIIPCPRCLIRKPDHLRGATLYAKTRNVLTSMALDAPCMLWAHDVFYLQKMPDEEITHPYISLFVCYTCGAIDAKPLEKINGEKLVQHFLEFAELSGGTPAVLLTDTARTEVHGPMATCLKDINVLNNYANGRILNAKGPPLPTTPVVQPLPRGPQQDKNPEDQIHLDPPNFKSGILENLSIAQKEMLLSDFVTSQPPLHSHITTHSPPPNHQFRSGRNTSLGRLDKTCLHMAAYVRRYITQFDQNRSNMEFTDFVSLLVKSYVHLNNFLLKDSQTGVEPAILHLGVLKTRNLTNFYEKISTEEAPITTKQIKYLQQLLGMARTHAQAEKNRQTRNEKAEARHLRQHGKLLSDENFLQKFQPLTLVYLRVEENQGKSTRAPFFTGPFIVVANILHSRVLYIYELNTGKMYKRSYRSLQKYLPDKMLPSLPINILNTWMEYHPLQILNKRTQQESQSPEDAKIEFKNILLNMEKLYQFLSPAIPSAQETQRTIQLYDEQTKQLEEENPEGIDHKQTESQTPEPYPEGPRVTFKISNPEPVDEIKDITKNKATIVGPPKPMLVPTQPTTTPQGPVEVAPPAPKPRPPPEQPTRRSTRQITRRQDPNFGYY